MLEHNACDNVACSHFSSFHFKIFPMSSRVLSIYIHFRKQPQTERQLSFKAPQTCEAGDIQMHIDAKQRPNPIKAPTDHRSKNHQPTYNTRLSSMTLAIIRGRAASEAGRGAPRRRRNWLVPVACALPDFCRVFSAAPEGHLWLRWAGAGGEGTRWDFTRPGTARAANRLRRNAATARHGPAWHTGTAMEQRGGTQHCESQQ